MRTGPPAAALQTPLRAPERLAMPLICALGLALVVSAAATGQSTLVVALAALLGFGVCALAPLALPSGAPASAMDDLLAVARDIRAGQQSAELLRTALTNWERTAVAAGEAIHALRVQCGELAETKAQSESQWLSAAQSHWAEMSEALKSLDAAHRVADGGGIERIEQMLVYLAETLERRDGEGWERVERRLADLARETQGVRGEITATVAQDKAAELQRQEALEARIFGKIDDALRVQTEREAASWVELWREQAGRLDRIESKVAEGEAKGGATLARVADKLRNAIDRLDTLSACAANAAATHNDELKAALKALEGQTLATLRSDTDTLITSGDSYGP